MEHMVVGSVVVIDEADLLRKAAASLEGATLLNHKVLVLIHLVELLQLTLHAVNVVVAKLLLLEVELLVLPLCIKKVILLYLTWVVAYHFELRQFLILARKHGLVVGGRVSSALRVLPLGLTDNLDLWLNLAHLSELDTHEVLLLQLLHHGILALRLREGLGVPVLNILDVLQVAVIHCLPDSLAVVL